MLKRQRPVSPPPGPSSTTPFFADSPVDLLIDRDAKRRRTAAPVLDGLARGWATQPDDGDGDDDECAYSEDEARSVPQPHSQEYKSANTMLRELHTLNQHRLLFVPPPTAAHASQTPVLRHSAFPNPATAAKYDQLIPVLTVPSPQKTDQQTPIEEATRVAQIYEGTNRFLGSLFLSRRRKLDSSDDIPGA